MAQSELFVFVLVGLCVIGVGIMVATLFTPRRIWLGVKLEAIPKPISRLWVIHLPYWMLSPLGKAAKIIFLGSGVCVIMIAIVYFLSS